MQISADNLLIASQQHTRRSDHSTLKMALMAMAENDNLSRAPTSSVSSTDRTNDFAPLSFKAISKDSVAAAASVVTETPRQGYSGGSPLGSQIDIKV